MIRPTGIIVYDFIDRHLHESLLCDVGVDGVNLIQLLLDKSVDVDISTHLLPSNTRITLKVGDAFDVAVFVNNVMQKDGEFLPPFIFGQERNISIDGQLLVIQNFGNDSRAR